MNQQAGNHNQQFNANTIVYNAAQSGPVKIIPFLRNKDFVSRDIEVGPGRTALYGLGGVGKSQIAIEHAYKQEGWVFWIHASSAARFDQDVRKIEAVVGNLYPWLVQHSWTIILDNLDTDFIFESQDNDPPRIELIPTNGNLLVTTRNREIASRVADVLIEIKPDKDHSTAIINNALGQGDDLAATLDYMPLAIAQAIAYIKRRRCTVQDYITKLETLVQREFRELRRDREAKNSILTWQISFEALPKSAAKLLSMMSFYDNQGIPELLAGGDEDLDVLCDYSFISRSDGYQMHRLVQLATQLWDRSGEREAVARLSRAFPFGEHETWPLCRMLYPHALRMLDVTSSAEQASILFNATWFAYGQGAYTEASQMITKARQVYEDLNMQPQKLACMNIQALVLYKQGDMKQAEAITREVLKQKESLGCEHPRYLISLQNLALILCGEGRFVESEELGRQAVEGAEKVLGKDHRRTLDARVNLGRTLYYQGKYEEAEEIHRHTAERHERVYGETSPNTQTSLSNWGLSLMGCEKYDEAEIVLRRAMTLSQQLGTNHPIHLDCSTNFAVLLARHGRYEKAERLDRYIYHESATINGPYNPATATALGNLALDLYHLGKYQESEELTRAVLEIDLKTFGQLHPVTLEIQAHLALLLDAMGKFQESEMLSRAALAGIEPLLGKSHPGTLQSMRVLVRILRSQGKSDEADMIVQRYT